MSTPRIVCTAAHIGQMWAGIPGIEVTPGGRLYVSCFANDFIFAYGFYTALFRLRGLSTLEISEILAAWARGRQGYRRRLQNPPMRARHVSVGHRVSNTDPPRMEAARTGHGDSWQAHPYHQSLSGRVQNPARQNRWASTARQHWLPRDTGHVAQTGQEGPHAATRSGLSGPAFAAPYQPAGAEI